MSIARTAATGGDLNPEFLEWSSSLPIDRRLLRVDCQGSIAHVQGLAAAGLLTQAEASTLEQALARLPQQVERGEVELPHEEDVHMAVEAWLRETVGPVADKLHTARSRNDQVATDLMLWCRATVVELRAAMTACIDGARAWAKTHGDTPMPAYTHRQVAIPVLARLWIDAAITQPLLRDRALLDAVDQELSTSPLGAGAIAGTTLPVDPSATAKALGFDRGPVNPIDAVGQRDHALLLVFVCARAATHLGRFSTDVIELCADGLCRLGGEIACGSSMMPHKRNPDLFELVRGQASQRCGDLVALVTLFQGLGSGYHRDLQHDKTVLFAAVDGILDALRMITLGLGHIELVPDACLRALADGDSVATDLTEGLVAEGVPFREAYERVGKLVAQQRAEGKRLVDLDGPALEAAGIPVGLLSRLDPAASARARS